MITVTAARQTTARYYVGKDRTKHYTEATFPAGEVLYHGPDRDVLASDTVIVCQVTPACHIAVDRADVTLE